MEGEVVPMVRAAIYEVGHMRKAAETIAKQAENFFDVALWYNRREIGNAVVSLHEKGLKACFS
jgi:hypothetical protein